MAVVPQPDDIGLLAKIGGAVFVAAAAIFSFLFHRVIRKHDDEIAEIKKIAVDAVRGEEFVGTIARMDKLFDIFAEHEKEDRRREDLHTQRYTELLDTTHKHHADILSRLLNGRNR